MMNNVSAGDISLLWEEFYLAVNCDASYQTFGRIHPLNDSLTYKIRHSLKCPGTRYFEWPKLYHQSLTKHLSFAFGA